MTKNAKKNKEQAPGPLGHRKGERKMPRLCTCAKGEGGAQGVTRGGVEKGALGVDRAERV